MDLTEIMRQHESDLVPVVEDGNRISGIIRLENIADYEVKSRIKYSIRTKLFARKLNMSVSDSGWNFGKVLSGIFDTYEKRAKK